jgi:hypothetical protein
MLMNQSYPERSGGWVSRAGYVFSTLVMTSDVFKPRIAECGSSLNPTSQEWPIDLKAWWKMGTEVESGDQRMFADGWWQMRSAFSEQGVFLFNPYGAPLGQDQSFRFPCDGLMGRSSKYVHEIVPDKTTKIQQLVCL